MSDDPALCQAASEHGCLGALARVVWTLTLPEDAPGAVAAGVAGAGPSAGVDADMHESLILVSAYWLGVFTTINNLSFDDSSATKFRQGILYEVELSFAAGHSPGGIMEIRLRSVTGAV